MNKRESLKCKMITELKERGASPYFERFVRFNKYKLVCYNAASPNVMGFSPPLSFECQFHCLLFKTSECSRIFSDWAKNGVAVKNYFGDFDPSSRYLYTVFNFLMFHKSKYQESRRWTKYPRSKYLFKSQVNKGKLNQSNLRINHACVRQFVI